MTKLRLCEVRTLAMIDYAGFRRPLTVLVAALLALPLAAPARAADDMSETRAVSGFQRIELQGAFTAEIIAGKTSSQVVVSGAPDVVARVTTEVRDGTLVVGMKRGTLPGFRSPKLEITLAKLRGFANRGAGSATIRGLAGGNIDIENEGAASIVVAGRAARANITLAGAGKIDATALSARDVTVENNGVGSVRVRASGDLTMTVNGIGEIRYAGKPAHVESHVNGIGRIGPV